MVNDKDYDWLNQYKWYVSGVGYAVRGDNVAIYMHRQILGLQKGDGKQVDHINHNKLDNSRCNLRICNQSQNQLNRKNTKGYYWHKRAKKWHASIQCNGKRIYLGLFNDKNDAYQAYLKAKKKNKIKE